MMRFKKYLLDNYQAKILIAIALSLSAILVIGVLLVYHKNSLLDINGRIDKDFFPAFGNFLGSTIGIVVGFTSIILIYYTYESQQEQVKITTGLVDRQIALSIKPELFLKDYYSETSTAKMGNLKLDKFPYAVPLELQDIDIKIINLGLESALYVEYNYEYLINTLKVFFDKISHRPFEIKIDKNTGFVEFYNNQEERVAMHSLEQHFYMKDYLMPYKQDNSSISARIPAVYLIVYYHVLFESLKNDLIKMDDFPSCYLNLTYNDLEGKKHQKKFKLIFEIHFMILNKEFDTDKALSFKIFCREVIS